jgi:peptidoglycan/xylan/chitin deacetylase (PgdA/CDA1 family)
MIGARMLGSLLSPAGARSRLSILIYHRVLSTPDPLFPLEVDAARIETQMQLVSTHFNVLPLAEAVERLQSGSLPTRAACITFDDGYADNAEIALPILQRHGLNATFFIATDYLDGGRMWNDDVIKAVRDAGGPELDLRSLGLGQHVVRNAVEKRSAIDAILGLIKYLPEQGCEQQAARIAEIAQVAMPTNLMMTTPQVRALHAAGMTIGGHTAHHPILARSIGRAVSSS